MPDDRPLDATIVDPRAAVIAQLFELEVAGSYMAALHFGPFTLFELTGALQLAARHPSIPASQCERFLAAARLMQAMFRGNDMLSEEVRAILERGFDSNAAPTGVTIDVEN